MLSSTRKHILAFANSNARFKTQDLAKKLKISRQTVAAHLKKLVEDGALTKVGSTKSAIYSLSTSKSAKKKLQQLRIIKNIDGLSEDRVFDEVCLRLGLKKLLSKNVFTIVNYAFSEMLNNAIDHSRSKKTNIIVEIINGALLFEIRDFGIGVYKNVMQHFKLQDGYEAADHLLKGKQTTMPSRHSGQGIFFTSRIADNFELSGNQVALLIDNELQDYALKAIRPFKGTKVCFSIKARSKKSLEKLFKDFANDDFEFDKNVVRLKLNKHPNLISRSLARRLTAGLEQFERITFDFKGVDSIGQAFADEIFRVFKSRNPKIQIDFENATGAVAFMLGRVLREEN